MKTKKGKRTYNMSLRADRVAQNEQKILEAAVSLWKEFSILDITLEKIAERSGVTVRTLLRKYGSKENLFEACLENDAAHTRMKRSHAPVGDIEASLYILLTDYESLGDASIRTLNVENELPVARKLLDAARLYHRNWCARVFGPYLPDASSPEYEERLLAFITATELYLWKLLRRDLHKSFEETFQVFKTLLEGLILKFQT